MSESARERCGAMSGVLFVVVLVAGTFLPPKPPAFDAPIADLRSYYVDHRYTLTLSWILAVVSVVAFLPFLTSMWKRISQAEGGDGWLGHLFFGAGLVAVALATVGTLLTSAIGQHIALSGDDAVLRSAHAVGGLVTFAGTLAPVSVLLLAAGLAGLRLGSTPRWMAWLALVGATLNLLGGCILVASDTSGLAALALVAFLLFVLWVLAVSSHTLVREYAEVAVEAAPSAARGVRGAGAAAAAASDTRARTAATPGAGSSAGATATAGAGRSPARGEAAASGEGRSPARDEAAAPGAGRARRPAARPGGGPAGGAAAPQGGGAAAPTAMQRPGGPARRRVRPRPDGGEAPPEG